jgi:hypothetical protein
MSTLTCFLCTNRKTHTLCMQLAKSHLRLALVLQAPVAVQYSKKAPCALRSLFKRLDAKGSNVVTDYVTACTFHERTEQTQVTVTRQVRGVSRGACERAPEALLGRIDRKGATCALIHPSSPLPVRRRKPAITIFGPEEVTWKFSLNLTLLVMLYFHSRMIIEKKRLGSIKI